MDVKELIRDLKYTVLHLPWSQIRKDADEVVGRAVATLEAQQARIAELEAELKEERRWIPVGERLPEPDKQVLAIVSGRWENITFDRAYELASWSSDEGWIMEAWPELEDPEVTYWMPLPEPPEVDG